MLTYKSNFTAELQWVIKMFTKLKKIRDFLSRLKNHGFFFFFYFFSAVNSKIITDFFCSLFSLLIVTVQNQFFCCCFFKVLYFKISRAKTLVDQSFAIGYLKCNKWNPRKIYVNMWSSFRFGNILC